MPPVEVANQQALPFETPALGSLDRWQRLDTMQRIEDFLPVSRQEQNRAIGLESVIERPAGAARHIREVIQHQNKANTSDPLAAARKITRQFGDWALDAVVADQHLSSLESELGDVLNPTLVLERVIDPKTMGVRAFLRYFDLSLIRGEHGAGIVGLGYDPQEVEYFDPQNHGIAFYAEEAASNWQVHAVRKRLPDARENEQKRSTFWLARLAEVKQHYPVLRPVALDVIDKVATQQAS